jgi:hypothetical protein
VIVGRADNCGVLRRQVLRRNGYAVAPPIEEKIPMTIYANTAKLRRESPWFDGPPAAPSV